MNKFNDNYNEEMKDIKPSEEFRTKLIKNIEKEQKKNKKSNFTFVKGLGIAASTAAAVALIAGGTMMLKNDGGSVNGNNKPGKQNVATNEPSDNEHTTIDTNHLSTYGALVTVEDIKKAYGVDDSDDVMPLYNVSQTENFTFNFNFDGYDADFDLYDYVSVHTDHECKEESFIYYTASMDVEDGKTTITVAPMEPVLKTDSQAQDYAFEGVDTWGNAPIYYLAVHVDMESEEPTLLEEPIIIPFTVKNEVEAPNAKGVVDSTGRFKLTWEPVEGADFYRVYNLTDGTLSTGEDNHAINGKEIGYKNLTMLLEAETTECEYNNFAGAQHGLAQIEDDMVTYEVGGNSDVNDEGECVFTVGQNYCVNGEFFVTAVKNGVEGGISAPITTADLVIPYEVPEEQDIIFNSYASAEDFPTEIEVINIDGSSSMHTITYERAEGVTYLGYYRVQYNYKIDGTAMTGYVYPEDQNTEPRFVGVPNKETGLVEPEDNVDKTPDASVETIIPPSEDIATPGDAEMKNEPEGLVEEQIENTKTHIALGNKKAVENVAEGVYIVADSAEEEWIALNLIQVNSEISVESFTMLQDPYVLSDTINKVILQNPFILGVSAYSYDYETFSIIVEYNISKEEIASAQEEIIKAAKDILEEIVEENMTDEEKVVAFYNYLRENVVYDEEALAAAEEHDFLKDELGDYESSFNAYGALVLNKGVCSSYSAAFKLFCDLSEIECNVVAGTVLGSEPHAWNEIVLDGEVYEIDPTSSVDMGDIPYVKSFADNENTEKYNYTRN